MLLLCLWYGIVYKRNTNNILSSMVNKWTGYNNNRNHNIRYQNGHIYSDWPPFHCKIADYFVSKWFVIFFKVVVGR